MNSFRKIPTPLYRALTKADFTKAEYKTILVIMDFTLGYNQRPEASISFSTFEKLTGLARSTVNEAVHSLITAKVISVSYQGNKHHKETVYTFNYQYETWDTGSNCIPVSSSENLPDICSEILPVEGGNHTRTGSVPMPAIPSPIPPIKKYIKKTLKENNKENLVSTNNNFNKDFQGALPPDTPSKENPLKENLCALLIEELEIRYADCHALSILKIASTDVRQNGDSVTIKCEWPDHTETLRKSEELKEVCEYIGVVYTIISDKPYWKDTDYNAERVKREKLKNIIPGLPPGVTDEFALEIESSKTKRFCPPAIRNAILAAVKSAREAGMSLPGGNGGTPKAIPSNRSAGAFKDLIERDSEDG